MENKTYYGETAQRGAFQGNLVTSDIYFNKIVFRLYISKRVAQSTNVLYVPNHVMLVSKDEFHDYDRYDFVFRTQCFTSAYQVWELLCKSIVRIDKFVNMNSDNIDKITEELYRILG